MRIFVPTGLLGLIFFLSLSYAYATTNKHDILVSGGRLSVYFESTFSASDKKKLLSWLESASDTITTLYGKFPVKQTNIHLYAEPRANEPVPWGEVWKNGEYKVNFHVNPRYPLSRFLSDWTASHELSHLFHPHPGNGNSWFGEGLASYYQNILRVRQGILSEQTAWQKLYDGFKRGERNEKRSGMTLSQASQNMRATRSFMHVYWGGAAYFLKVDIRLRQISGGKKSLDLAWYKFRQCCLHPGNHWPVKKLISKLDQLTATTIFSEEYNKMIDNQEFPDYQTSLQQLGITIRNGKVVLSNSKPAATLRRQLLTANKL